MLHALPVCDEPHMDDASLQRKAICIHSDVCCALIFEDWFQLEPPHSFTPGIPPIESYFGYWASEQCMHVSLCRHKNSILGLPSQRWYESAWAILLTCREHGRVDLFFEESHRQGYRRPKNAEKV
ncbi:hypothetical protein MRB53_040839 [Persea americana]|nr:hypothetical protein MRB53_040839 [Persea americana]